MIKRCFENIINRFGIWRAVQICLVSFSVILFATSASQIFIPVHVARTDGPTKNISEFIPDKNILSLLNENKDETKEAIPYRPGMFKPATGLRDKPIADKTIDRIRDQLKLQCVMEMNGRPVAYINIQGMGLKKCCIGDNINDLFTVLDINQQNKSVNISIVEHKITLYL